MYIKQIETHTIYTFSITLLSNMHLVQGIIIFLPTLARLVSMIHCLTKVLSFPRTTILHTTKIVKGISVRIREDDRNLRVTGERKSCAKGATNK